MKVQSKKKESLLSVTSENINDFDNEFKKEVSYGLEYVIDEIISDALKSKALNSKIDWFGLSDLTLE